MSQLQPISYTEINRLHGNAVGILEGSVVVTAAREGEGTSLMAYTMALRSAENGTPTLLVDMNLKNTQLSTQLGLPRANWDLANEGLAKITDHIENDESQANLHYLAAPSDAASVEWLKDFRHAQDFLNKLSEDYRQVVIDTTPIGLLNRANADPVILAAAAARTVLVVLGGVTPRVHVKRAADQLEKSGAQLAGVVLNEWQNPSLKDDLLKLVAGLQKRSPGLASWLRHKIHNSDQL